MMYKYKIEWKDKSAAVKADDATEAIRKLGGRLVFGAYAMFANLSGWNCDADTCGERWAQAWSSDANGDRFRVMATRI